MTLPSERVMEQGPRVELSTVPKSLEPRRYFERGGMQEEGPVDLESSTPPSSPPALSSKFATRGDLTMWQVMIIFFATSTIGNIFNPPSHVLGGKPDDRNRGSVAAKDKIHLVLLQRESSCQAGEEDLLPA